MTILSDAHELAGALATWVRRRLASEGPDAGELHAELLATPPSGNSNLTLPFAVTTAEGARSELVLRLQHPSNQIFLDADVVREFHLLKALAADPHLPAPVACWSETDEAVLGHQFFVMERVAGAVPAGMPSIHVTGWLAQQSSDRRRTAVRSTIDALVAVHRFDWRSHAPFLADGANGTTMVERIDHLAAWYRWTCAGRAFPVTDVGLDHLRSTVGSLATAPVGLIWGDARLGNTMFGDDARVAALLDWELASVGPPALDVAWWLAFEEFSTVGHGIEPLEGLPTPAETVAHYEHRAGVALDDLDWFVLLATWMITVTVIKMTDIGIAEGRLAPGSRMGHGNITAQMLARRLDLPIPELDPDYAARRGLR